MSKINFDKQLQEQLSQLPEHTPQRDLWEGIEPTLVRQEVNNTPQTIGVNLNKGMYAIAVSLVICAVIGYLSIVQLSTPALTSNDNASALLAALHTQHEQQKQALLVSFEQLPAVTENWETQLVELETAAKAVRTALVTSPNNPALLKLLQSIYQQQLALIETVHAPKWQRI